MGQVPLFDTPEFRALKAALEEEWPHRSNALHASGVFLNEGDDDGDGDDGDDGDDGAGAGGDGEQKPPWGDDFDPERAWNTIKNLREAEAKLKKDAAAARAKVQEFEDKDKTEAQKLAERATAAEQRAAEVEGSALRLEVALDKAPEGMSIAQVRKLAKRLTGSNKEELEADAEELFADFASDGDGGGQEPLRGPKERLRSGAAPSESDDEEIDPDKLAELVPRRYKL